MKLNRHIKSLRKKMNLDQYEFSKVIGISQSFLSKVENDKTHISGQRLIHIAKIAKKHGISFPLVVVK